MRSPRRVTCTQSGTSGGRIWHTTYPLSDKLDVDQSVKCDGGFEPKAHRFDRKVFALVRSIAHIDGVSSVELFRFRVEVKLHLNYDFDQNKIAQMVLKELNLHG